MPTLQTVCDQLPQWAHVALWITVLLWEYGLGKTKFGSTVGIFVETPFKKLTNFVLTGSFKDPVPTANLADLLKPPPGP